MPAEHSDLVYLSVKISPDGISELSGNRSVVFLAKSDIQRIDLISGSGSENPGLQFGFGLILALVGACGFMPLWTGNMTLFRYEIGFVFFGAIGIWLIWETLRKRTYSLVWSRSGNRKIFFNRSIEPKLLSEFLV